MASFLALYRGPSLKSAEIIAVSSDPEVVKQFADELLDRSADSGDPVVDATRRGRRHALRLIKTESEDRSSGSASASRPNSEEPT